MLKRLSLLASLSLLAPAHPSSAQTIYLPVQFEYDASGQRNFFYYGGSDPLVFRLATMASADPSFGRSAGVAFHSSGNGSGRGGAFVGSGRVVGNDGPQIYSDAMPGVNVARFGYTITDARNAANRSVPTYFRMADLRAAAIPLADGSRVVPPNAAIMAPAAQPVAAVKKEPPAKGVIIIIPYKKPAAAQRPIA